MEKTAKRIIRVLPFTVVTVLLSFAPAVFAFSKTQVKVNRVTIKRIETLLEDQFRPNQPGGVALIAHRDRAVTGGPIHHRPR